MSSSSISKGSLLLLLGEATLGPLQLAVQEECSEPAGDVVVGEESEVEMGELEGHWKLIVQLMNNVQELEEERGRGR